MDRSSTRPLMGAAYPEHTFDVDYVQEASRGRRAVSTPLSLTTGTGYSIYKSTIIPAIKAAQREVVLVTCFWAASVTRDGINEALKELANKARVSSSKIAVQICFSSSSLPRNMLLPTPKEGQRYPPSMWKKLGLPGPDELTGLHLRVVRKFFWPFGIIHSKYVIVDRKLAIFPSCNISWERWYEVAICMQGPVVEHLLSFHAGFWDGGPSSTVIQPSPKAAHSQRPADMSMPAPTTLLSSPHTPTLLPNHLQPRALAGRCPCLPNVPSTFSPTPLLKTTYHLLSTAGTSIIMLTPNLTEPTVLDALSEALERGVHICIWTNRNLMTMEQLVTAGTTTPNCIQKLRKASQRPGNRASLEIFYFDDVDGPGNQQVQEGDDRELTPVKLHAKVTIIDGEKILLGSGNMDAASWKTSQELGVLIESRRVVEEFKRQWQYRKLEP